MKLYSIGQISPEEKSDILEKHRTIYDGYTIQQPVSIDPQPLYVQDFAGDKDGITLSNKGVVKKYTNIGINEQTSKKSYCSECGGMMQEGECSECGWKTEGSLEEMTPQVKSLKNVKDLNKSDKFDYVEETDLEETEQGNPYDNMETPYDFLSGGPKEQVEQAIDGEIDFEPAFDDFDDSESIEDYDDLEAPLDPKKYYGENKKKYYGDEDVEVDSITIDDLDDEIFLPTKDDNEEEEWAEVDDDVRESFISNKNKIMEMMTRMKNF